MGNTRQNRIDAFAEFYKDSEKTFEGFLGSDARATEFQTIYMLNICPGSRAGGTNQRLVEVFWGSRNFETEAVGRNWKGLSEFGATIIFERADNGFVIVLLYPAYSENRKPIETCITLYRHLDPNALRSQQFLKRCWKDFMAYMEVTSLDGQPSFLERLRVFKLRAFRRLVVESRAMPTRFAVFSKDVLKYVLTVGLSGSIVYLVTLASRPSESTTDMLLRDIDSNLKKVVHQIEEVSNKRNQIEMFEPTVDSMKSKSMDTSLAKVTVKTK